jgi:hypothetical protein
MKVRFLSILLLFLSSSALFAEFGASLYHLKVEFYGSKKLVDRYYMVDDIKTNPNMSLPEQHAILEKDFRSEEAILFHNKPLYFLTFVEENQTQYVQAKTIKSFKIISIKRTSSLGCIHELPKSAIDTIISKKCYIADVFFDPRFGDTGYRTVGFHCYNPKLNRKYLWKLYNKYAAILCTSGVPNSWEQEVLSKEALKEIKKYRQVCNLFRSLGVFLSQEMNPC